MALYALVSAGGSPGVTTSALALTLGWPSQVILAECDPSGGDILAGLFAGHVPATRGLLNLALDAGRGADVASRGLWPQLIELDDARQRLLLAGISDPRQGAGLALAWPALATAFASLPADVIADCGRLDAGEGPLPVITAASAVVLVLRPSLRQVARARSRIEMLGQLLGGLQRVTLLLLDGDGTHSPREVSKTLGVPVTGTLPYDRKTAGVLSDGAGSRRSLQARPLLRAAVVTGRALRGPAGGAAHDPGLAPSDFAPTDFAPTDFAPPTSHRPAGPGPAGRPAWGQGHDRPALAGRVRPAGRAPPAASVCRAAGQGRRRAGGSAPAAGRSRDPCHGRQPAGGWRAARDHPAADP